MTDTSAVSTKAYSFHPMILSRLQNLGNTCYFNAGVQLLVNCPGFIYSLWDSPSRHGLEREARALRNSGSRATFNLYKSLAQVVYDMEALDVGPNGSLSPVRALDALSAVNPSFEGRAQQDCAEMLTCVLGAIEDEGRVDLSVAELLTKVQADSAAFTQAQQVPPPAPRPWVEYNDPDTTRTRAGASACRRRGSKKRKASATSPTMLNEEGRRADVEMVETLPVAPTEVDAETEVSVANSTTAPDPIVPLHGAQSSHYFNALRFMHKVNEENKALYEAESARARGSLDSIKRAARFEPPKVYYNSTTDGFSGYLRSDVRCHACGVASRVVYPYNSLLVDLPSDSQRRAYARAHPEVHRRIDADTFTRVRIGAGVVWWNPLTYFSSLFHWCFRRFFSDLPPLTLEECLDLHFAPEVLSGSNQYKCGSCGQWSDATKTTTLLTLPEYLIIQMKRFKAGVYFTSKKMDPVGFPMAWEPLPEGADTQRQQEQQQQQPPSRPYTLDLRHYMDPLVAQDLPAVPPGLEAGRPPVAASRPDGHLVSSYTLEATVHHRGSYGGGHYVTYAKKDDSWVFISDDAMAKVAEDEVRDNTVEPYLFLYSKQPLVQPREGDLRLELQALAQNYLHKAAAGRHRSSSGGSSSSRPVYISRMWLHRMAFFHDPGPIFNPLCYCTPQVPPEGGAPVLQPFVPRNEVTGSGPRPAEAAQLHVHGPPAAWYYVEVEEADYNKFYQAYGGTQPVTKAVLEEVTKNQNTLLRAYSSAA